MSYFKMRVFLILSFTISILISCSKDEENNSPTDKFLIYNSCQGSGCVDYGLNFFDLEKGTTDFLNTNYVNYSTHTDVAAVGNKLFLSIFGSTSGIELWVFDKSLPFNALSNPKLVFDINPGATSSNPQQLFVFDKKVYFSALDATLGRELMVFDSTQDPSSTNPSLVQDIHTGSPSSNPADFARINSKLYFSATDNVNGKELWVYDTSMPVSSTNPTFTLDINPGSSSSNPQTLNAIGDKLIFCAFETVNGRELWVLDSNTPLSSTNPSLIYDLNPGSLAGCQTTAVKFNNKLYFVGANAAAGSELFVYDPSQSAGPQNPSLISDLTPGATGSSPSNLYLHNNTLVFSADVGSGVELGVYEIDKSVSFSNPTVLNLETSGGSTPGNFVGANNQIYFTAENSLSGNEPWVLNLNLPLSSTNPKLLKDIHVGVADSDLLYLTATSQGSLFFSAYTVSEGEELYRLQPNSSDPVIFKSLPALEELAPDSIFAF